MAKLETSRDLGTASIRGGISRKTASPSDFFDASAGNAFKLAGDAFDFLAKKREEAEETDAEVKYISMVDELDNGQRERADQMQPGAPGYRDNEQKVYTERVKSFNDGLSKRLQKKYAIRTAKLGANLGSKAEQYEEQELDRFQAQRINEGLSTIEKSIYENPDQRDELITAGEKLIGSSSYSVIEKQELTKKWRQQARFGAIQRRIETDPNYAQGVSDSVATATELIKGFEGFRNSAYWDVNAHRVGFGSDTITKADGSIERVKKGSTVSRADAYRDLVRREKEFRNTARNDIGEEAWNRLPSAARAALTSTTYNYGSLSELKGVVKAARSGNVGRLADAIEKLASHNKGINARRRKKEAAVIRASADFKDIDVNNTRKLVDFAQSEASRVEKEQDKFIRSASIDIRKDGYALAADDQLTREWVDANRDVLTVSDHRALLKATEPDTSTRKTDPREYLSLLDLVDADPVAAQNRVRDLYSADQIAKADFISITSKAEKRLGQAPTEKYDRDFSGYVRRTLAPKADAPKSHYSRQLDAVFAFEDWVEDNPKSDRDEMRAKADEIIQDFRKIRYPAGQLQMPRPAFLPSDTPINAKTLEEARAKTIMKFKLINQKPLQAGEIASNKRQLTSQLALIRQWASVAEDEQ